MTKDKARKTSMYNIYRSYLKRRGTSLNTADLSLSWTLANKSKAENEEVIHGSFTEEYERISNDLNKGGGGPPDRSDILDALVKSDFSSTIEQEFADYQKQSGLGEQAAADISRNEYKTTDGKRASLPTGSNPTGNGSGSGPAGLGSFVKSGIPDGMGTKNPLTGNFVRSGESFNAGGGIVDTRVSSDADTGDQISLGPGSTKTGTKTLRPKFPMAGEDSVKGTVVEEATSNVVFEAFSVVPPGHGLGPNNTLDKLNQSVDFLRFGVGPLSLPRSADPEYGIKSEIMTWENDQAEQFIVAQVKNEANAAMEAAGEAEHQVRNPETFIEDGPDINVTPSSQALPRSRPTPYTTVYDNRRLFLPSTTPSGLFLSNVPFKPNDGRSGHRGDI